MNYNGFSASIDAGVISLDGIVNNVNGINFSTNWNSLAGEQLLTSLDTEIGNVSVLKGQLDVFSKALAMTSKVVELNSKIDDLQKQLAELELNSKANAKKIAELNIEIEGLIKTKNDLVDKINSMLSTITGFATDGGSSVTVPANELSYDDAVELAKQLQVPVEYILSLHLHEGYKIGDRLIPEGITPDIIHYAGENGFPILIGGISYVGDSYKADAPERGTYFFKTADKFSVVNGGSEYNIQGWPITFGETEGRDVYWTYYGPISQGNVLNKDAAPIQCTATDLFPCDDGLYRDKDGYIVIAGSPYVNQFYDGVHVNYEANGGMNYEDMFVVTPFGLARFYDHGAIKVEGGIECDFYVNDGYESNNVAETEYGRRLRESAVEGYESSNLYWNQMIH